MTIIILPFSLALTHTHKQTLMRRLSLTLSCTHTHSHRQERMQELSHLHALSLRPQQCARGFGSAQDYFQHAAHERHHAAGLARQVHKAAATVRRDPTQRCRCCEYCKC